MACRLLSACRPRGVGSKPFARQTHPKADMRASQSDSRQRAGAGMLGWSRRSMRCVWIVAWAAGCGSSSASDEAQAPPTGYWEHSPRVCGVDETREYFCDDLLPLRSALSAPEPYSQCPGHVEGHQGEIDPTPTVAVFDASYTAYMRSRMPPGHTCCFSWCARIPLADASQVDPNARCSDGLAIRENYCFEEPEQGTSYPGAPPYARCPRSIRPPESAVFYAPPGALFDPLLTAQRRQVGLRQCCYAWCSIAPPNSGMHAR